MNASFGALIEPVDDLCVELLGGRPVAEKLEGVGDVEARGLMLAFVEELRALTNLGRGREAAGVRHLLTREWSVTAPLPATAPCKLLHELFFSRAAASPTPALTFSS